MRQTALLQQKPELIIPNFTPTLETIKIAIRAKPKGQERPDMMVARDKDGNPVKNPKNGRFVMIPHKSDDQKADEQTLAALLAPYRIPIPISGPIYFGLRCYMAIPNSCPEHYKSCVPKGIGQNAWFQWAARNNVVQPLRTPDFDNVLKHIKDIMTKLSFWRDDAQIVRIAGASGKYYGDVPGYEITVQYWAELQLGWRGM
ncbi:MAG: RusA family crossover junction endodeoxyribonuclease [Syntrophobacteraceae bacterium]